MPKFVEGSSEKVEMLKSVCSSQSMGGELGLSFDCGEDDSTSLLEDHSLASVSGCL